MSAIDPNGPFLDSALVCEKVLQEQDGVVSAIRIIDRIYFVMGPDRQLLFPRQPITFLIIFKSGSARGRYAVQVRREQPSGEVSGPLFEPPVLFEGEDRGVNLVVNAMFEPDQEGLYRFDVLFVRPESPEQSERITRIPLRAIFQPMATVGPPG